MLDWTVASKLVESLSNMMEVNDSVVAAVDKKSSVTKQILKTINTFTQNVALEVGKHVKYGTLNRDRSGKIVMNLSLVLLLLNIVFIIAANLKPPSVACMALAATWRLNTQK
ncbi:hypothetical protein E2C01_033350 [Portunus trituberculatus]|uniref:Uncharacterized protein n=1 Tax=Portunus trituberculatus TaxID=210409 RepID=A0A5B7EYG6_PORTR|nr:hypothetical protein [Portunus trituberculatus]